MKILTKKITLGLTRGLFTVLFFGACKSDETKIPTHAFTKPNATSTRLLNR